MTKTEFLNDLIYDMAGYLDTSGVDRLKNVVACKYCVRQKGELQ